MREQLQAKIEAYADALDKLETTPSAPGFLGCLLARDSLESALSQLDNPILDVTLRAVALDKRLRAHADALADLPDLSAWRQVVKPADSAWWWHLERTPEPTNVAWDTLLTTIAGVLFTLALSTGLEVTQRFLTAGGDFTAYLLATVQALFATITGGSFTRPGHELLSRIWQRLGIRHRLRHGAFTVLALALFAFVVGLRLSLPAFARWYNARGVAQMQVGQATSAMHNFQRAIGLAPDFAQAHYNLGNSYENLLEYDKAITEYRIAVRADARLDAAYNNLGRLLIIHAHDYPLAVLTLRQGLVNAQDNEARYAIQKNLGWAYVASGQYNLAIEPLRRATSLYGDRGAPHCLLAQAHEGLEDNMAALSEWEQCLAYVDLYDPYENGWAALARQRLEAQLGGKP